MPVCTVGGGRWAPSWWSCGRKVRCPQVFHTAGLVIPIRVDVVHVPSTGAPQGPWAVDKLGVAAVGNGDLHRVIPKCGLDETGSAARVHAAGVGFCEVTAA